MKSILLSLCIAIFSQLFGKEIVFNNLCTDDIDKLNSAQKRVLLKSFSYGAEFDFGYTLAAIAWQESCAGAYRVNFQDPSAGIYHAYIPSVLNRHPYLKKNGLTSNMLGERLIRDDEFAASEAIRELLYWRGVHNNNWKSIVKSYNKGFSWQNSKSANTQAIKYYNSIANKVSKLKPFIESQKNQKSANITLEMPIYRLRNLPSDFKFLSE